MHQHHSFLSSSMILKQMLSNFISTVMMSYFFFLTELDSFQKKKDRGLRPHSYQMFCELLSLLQLKSFKKKLILISPF